MASYDIAGVCVSFARRDITQATDAEMDRIKRLVDRELHDHGHHRVLEELVIESDHVDRDSIRYRTVTRTTCHDLDELDDGD